MSRFYSFTSTFLAVAFFGLYCLSAHAQDIYKWTDADGKVHYGDRAAAPENSKKMNVIVAPPSEPQAVPALAASSHRHPPAAVASRFGKKSVPVDPALVAPTCKGLIEKIAAVPPGTNWEALYHQFDSTCPSIAYECMEYQSNPQNNHCIWVERSGSRVLTRNKYP
jgi:hypothetical protein